MSLVYLVCTHYNRHCVRNQRRSTTLHCIESPLCRMETMCRPSCASRPAKRQNVRFFADPAAAEAAGLRACKRCQPRAAQGRDILLIQSLARYIEKNAGEALTLSHLAKRVHLSPAHLQRTFKTVLGVSPKQFHDAARMQRLKGGLKAGMSVLGAITDSGFQSTSRVYGQVLRKFGMTPSAYRGGGAGETIAYAVRDTALGPLMMAATDRGVCFAQFGESEAALNAQLKSEFPNASHAPSSMAGSSELDAWIQAFEAHISGDAPRPALPLDLRGTAFQIRVWRFLLQVPDGDVLSYAELATGIGGFARRRRPVPPTGLRCWCRATACYAGMAGLAVIAGGLSGGNCNQPAYPPRKIGEGRAKPKNSNSGSFRFGRIHSHFCFGSVLFRR